MRRQQQDVTTILHLMRDLNDWQSKLFLDAAGVLVSYRAPELQPLQDQDVAGAAAALAATFETSVRGVLYDHRPDTPPAQRLAAALTPLFKEAVGRGGTALERDAAVVLRRLEEAVATATNLAPGSSRALMDLLGRVVRNPEHRPSEVAQQGGSGLIVL